MLVCLSGIFLKKCTETLLIGLKIKGKLPNFWNLLGLCLQTLSSLLVLALIHSSLPISVLALLSHCM